MSAEGLWKILTLSDEHLAKSSLTSFLTTWRLPFEEAMCNALSPSWQEKANERDNWVKNWPSQLDCNLSYYRKGFWKIQNLTKFVPGPPRYKLGATGNWTAKPRVGSEAKNWLSKYDLFHLILKDIWWRPSQSHLRYLQSHKSQQNKQVNKHEGFSWAHRVNLCHGVGSHVEK